MNLILLILLGLPVGSSIKNILLWTTKSDNIKWHEVIDKTLRQAKIDKLESPK